MTRRARSQIPASGDWRAARSDAFATVRLIESLTSSASGSASNVLRWLRATRAPVAARDCHLAGTPAEHPVIDEVVAELAELGVRRPLRFVWSIDGSGVEEDVPDVIHLHRTMLVAERAPAPVIAASERYAALTLRATIRHEIGHALLFARPRDARRPAFRRLFGDVRTTYRVGTVVQEVGRRVTRHGGLANPRYQHVVSLYAASHPHEQFAEAVRVALGAGANRDAIRAWGATHGVGERAITQIEYAADWLQGY